MPSSTLEEFLEAEDSDPDLMPTILPVDARLSFRGNTNSVLSLFQKLLPIVPDKELIFGTTALLIEANEDGTVRSTATDGEKSMRVVVGAMNVSMPGAALIPARKPYEILKMLDGGRSVQLDVIGNTCFIRYRNTVWEIVTPVGDSLPPLANVDDITRHTVDRWVFHDALKAVWKALPPFRTSSPRPSLVQVEVADGRVTACDGARVHRKKVEGLDPRLHFSIPAAVAEILIKETGSTSYDGDVLTLGVDDYHLYFQINDNEIIAQRLMIPYPDIDTIMLSPALMNEHRLTVNVAELKESITRARVNADPDYSTLYIQITPGKDESWSLLLRARDKQGNSSRETLSASFTGPQKAREIKLSAKYLQDLLSVVEAEEVTFRIGDDTKSRKFPLFLENLDGFTAVIQQPAVN